MNEKQRYYANLERQQAAESFLRQQGLPRSGKGDVDPVEELYAEMGQRTFAAFQNCLDWLANIGGRRSELEGGADRERLEEAVTKAVSTCLKDLTQDLATVKEQFGKLETMMSNLEAGIRRIDKYTLEAFRQLSETKAEVEAGQQALVAGKAASGRRMAREDARRMALEAARRMAENNKTLSLAAIAREAGLKYGQIVYAFGNKDNFFSELQREMEMMTPGSGEEANEESAQEAVAGGEIISAS
ncbi:MAG TPA: hypothetical protein GXX29_10240 [Firmicutes bacterium]|nr:hypothetical protein [Bacillota bacterium]